MRWPDAEAAIRAEIEARWAASPWPTCPLLWENEPALRAATFVAVTIEGTYADKTIFGGAGARSSVEAGVVFCHVFVPVADGKQTALAMVDWFAAALELRSIGAISFDGANPPSPVALQSDRELRPGMPGGMYFRCSGSVPFIVIDAR